MSGGDIYTHGHHESVLRSHTWRTVENSAAYLIDELRPGLSLLDVGCGPGTITVDLARRVAPGRVIGFDPAEDVVRQAATFAIAEAVDVAFETGDVYALRYDDSTFDVVHAHQVLQHLSKPVAALREMRRVTRPGGIVAARDCDYSSFEWAPKDSHLDRWVELYRMVARRNGGEPDAGRFLEAWALEAGFTDVLVSNSTWTYADPESCAWWGSLHADRCEFSAFGEQAVEYQLATRDEILDIAGAWRAWGAKPAAHFTVPHGEVLARV